MIIAKPQGKNAVGDFIDAWSRCAHNSCFFLNFLPYNGICFVRRAFYQVGIGGIAVSGASLYLLGICQETALIGGVVGVYWMLGISDMNQTKHTILRNFPVLGRLRYIFEVLRPEIRQVCFAPQSSRWPPLAILGAASARWHGAGPRQTLSVPVIIDRRRR